MDAPNETRGSLTTHRESIETAARRQNPLPNPDGGLSSDRSSGYRNYIDGDAYAAVPYPGSRRRRQSAPLSSHHEVSGGGGPWTPTPCPESPRWRLLLVYRSWG